VLQTAGCDAGRLGAARLIDASRRSLLRLTHADGSLPAATRLAGVTIAAGREP
jgi:hypothetical protein